MGRPPTWLVGDRRESVLYFLKQGLSPQEIAKKLKKRLVTIERDIEVIEKEAQERREAKKALVEAEERNLRKEFARLKARREKLPKPKAPVSRGPKKSMTLIERRRWRVNVFRVLGRTQRRIAELLDTPLRTIQRDCYSLDIRVMQVYRLKWLERCIKKQLGWLEDAEILEWLLGSCSEERGKEIFALNDGRRKRGDPRPE